MKAARIPHRGFTLIELMTAITIAAILFAVGTPMFTTITQNSRLRSSAFGLASDLSLARTEAVRRGRTVSVCTSTNGTSCSNSGWLSGRLVFTDGGAVGQVDGTDVILLTSEAMPTGITIDAANGDFGTQAISFDGGGRIIGPTNNDSVRFCTPGREARLVRVQRPGNATIQVGDITCP
jgi:type IV fimbrial biogenesis protein FimT